MAISNSALANQLGQDQTFIGRVMIQLLTQATLVLAESGSGTQHDQRIAYAQRVIESPRDTATRAAPYMAQTTNVIGTITIEDVGVVTSVTDAALTAQMAASWDTLAGVATGAP